MTLTLFLLSQELSWQDLWVEDIFPSVMFIQVFLDKFDLHFLHFLPRGLLPIFWIDCIIYLSILVFMFAYLGYISFISLTNFLLQFLFAFIFNEQIFLIPSLELNSFQTNFKFSLQKYFFDSPLLPLISKFLTLFRSCDSCTKI